jgi:hypothetical protein
MKIKKTMLVLYKTRGYERDDVAPKSSSFEHLYSQNSNVSIHVVGLKIGKNIFNFS